MDQNSELWSSSDLLSYMDHHISTLNSSNNTLQPPEGRSTSHTPPNLDDQIQRLDDTPLTTFLASGGYANDDENYLRPRSVPSSPARVPPEIALKHIAEQLQSMTIQETAAGDSEVSGPLGRRTNSTNAGSTTVGTYATGFGPHHRKNRRQGNTSTNTDVEGDILNSENWSDDERPSPVFEPGRVSVTPRRPVNHRENKFQSDTTLVTTEHRIDPDFISNDFDASNETNTLTVQMPQDKPDDLAAIYRNNIDAAKEEGKNDILIQFVCGELKKAVDTSLEILQRSTQSLHQQYFGMSMEDCYASIQASIDANPNNTPAAKLRRHDEAHEAYDREVGLEFQRAKKVIAWTCENSIDHIFKRCDILEASGIDMA